MKTIEITDELYDKLMALSTEINNQNHRGTAMPYIFQVQERKRIYEVDENNSVGYDWISGDYEQQIEDKREEKIEAIKESRAVDFFDCLLGHQLDELIEENGFILEDGWFIDKDDKENKFKDGPLIDKIDALKEKNINPESKVEDDHLDELLEDAGWIKNYFRYEETLSNAFLTAKSCKEHIEKNHYHYSEPVDYLSGCFRNSEMETVYEFLCGLSGGKMHK